VNPHFPLVLRLFARFVPADLREPIAGDLHEEYLKMRARHGGARAAGWLWWNAAQLALTFRCERSAHGRPLPPIGEELRGLGSMWDGLRQDIGFGVRMLRRQPGFTVVVLMALALGIGANTAIFSVVDTVLWRPLPFPASDRLVSIAEQRPREGRLHGFVAPADFYDWRRDATSFIAMAAADSMAANLTGSGEPERLRGMAVSSGFLTVLGTAPARGRDFRAEEETPGRHRVVLLTDGLWRRRFGADPSIVGRAINLNGNPYDVVGILPPDFWWGSQPEFVAPYPIASGDPISVRAQHSMEVVARLRPGVSIEQARAELDTIGRRLSEEFPQTNTGHSPHTIALQDSLVSEIRPALLVLLGAVGLVLLIACANVATLLLARATGRQKEMAVRIAIGAGRPRLVRQMLTESVLLALAGGGAGLLLAVWGLSAMRTLLPAQFAAVPGFDRLAIDGRVLAVAVIVSAVTGLVFGAIPALAASDLQTGSVLHEEGRGGIGGVRSGRMRAALVIGEMALSLVLLVGAGLLMVSFKHLVDVSPGFRSEHIVAAQIALPANRYAERGRVLGFYQVLLERLRSAPGVDGVEAVSHLPFSGQETRTGFSIEGRRGPSPIPVRAHPRLVTPGYLAMMGVPLVRGRFFTARDADGAPPVVIINEAAARRFWPDEDPIGKRIGFNIGPEPRLREIVGIVGDIKHAGLDADSNPEAYLPHLQTNFFSPASMNVVVRSASGAAIVAPLLRAAVAELDKDQPLGVIRSLDDLIAGSVAPRRLNLVLLVGFAAVALTLTAFGLYGVMAYLVAQRTREIGVRMALGATRSSVLQLVLRQAGVMALAGIAIGLVGALALTRFLATLLFGVSTTDPIVYAAVAALLSVVALLAVAIPSARATRVDPLSALRT
jgi:putative ABC transport system permease protein